MINRFLLIFSLLLLIIFSIYALFTRPILCTDPAGCLWIGPEDPVVLGLSGITTGQDRSLSIEIQHSLELFSQNSDTSPTDHPIKFKTYYSSCLPNVPVQSVIDLASDPQILAVIGPICAQDGSDFAQRLAGSQKVTISPIPYRSDSTNGGITVYPDLEQLTAQSAMWVQRLGYSRIILTHDTDSQSKAFSKNFCEIFNAIGTCLDSGSGSNDFQDGEFDAVVQVFLDESNPPSPDSDLLDPLLPKILVSFSRPLIVQDQISTNYWIGPQAWNENLDFSLAYYAEYNNYPSSLASWLLYEQLPKIYNTVRNTAISGWDGSWVIPISNFKQQLESDFASDDIFCLAGKINCSKIRFVLYQVSGNEYKLINP